jgi:hypothetical protein
MAPIRAIRRLAGMLAGQATVVLASFTVAPAALADPRPGHPAGTSTRRCRTRPMSTLSWTAASPAGSSP